MHTAVSTLGLLAALSLGTFAQGSATADTHFPPSSALAEGVSPDALADLDQLVQGLVDDEEVVGAELLVLVNGKTILNEAYGWSDREAEVPLETGSVFCVRSMTKPVVGAAILMLVEEDLIDLDDRAAQYLPSFDVEGSRDITVLNLLMHTSGLTMSLLLGKDLRELDGIQAVAELGGGYALDFEPGSSFQYSDQGTDTLTALIEVVSGMPAAEFVRTRLLEPLGMRDSACVMTEDSRLRERGLPKYAGARGAWNRFWSPDDPELFPFFLGSQGLYSTTRDYALFMDFWRSKGRAGKARLLGSRYVRKALEPGPFPFGGTGLPGLRAEYGFLMQLWTAEGERGERDVVAFGHGGSDGTHAWVFPEQKAIVMYFTQSRGNTTGLLVEEALGSLFLGASFDPNQAAPPMEEYLGYYWEGEGDRYRTIVRDGDEMALEILGRAVVPLSYAGDDRWKMRPDPSKVLEFQRSESGEVTGYRIGDHEEFRFEPSADLPTGDELAERVVQAHRIDLVESLGPIRMNAELTIERLGITGELSTLVAWPDRVRIDSVAGGESERIAFEGGSLWYASGTKPVATMEGQAAELLRLDHFFARFGDWRRWYPRLQVIQRIKRGNDDIFMVRAGDTSAPAPTLYVDAETGRFGRIDSMTHIEGMGRIGRSMTFADFRDVSGMTLPFRSEVEFANPMVGLITMETKVGEVELGVAVAEGAFTLQ